jgi:hypothetical protein
MQSMDVWAPGLPDLQFVLLVIALCTSKLASLNVPEALCRTIFDRCWILVNETPPPVRPEDRVLDLRHGTETTLEALAVTIRSLLGEAGITTLEWDHPPSEATLPSSPEARPLIDRLQHFDPTSKQPPDPDAKS